jgi:hypothetical protein
MHAEYLIVMKHPSLLIIELMVQVLDYFMLAKGMHVKECIEKTENV